MARPTVTPPDRWVEAGLRALAAGGPDAVRVEVLARSLGVSKGGFYNHFEDRPALLAEMLETWEQLVIDQVIAVVEEGGGDAREKLRRLFALGTSGRRLMGVELAIRDWARRDQHVARRLRRIDNRRMDYLRSLFAEFCADEDEVEMRSLVAMAFFIGLPSIAADRRGRRGELISRAHEWLLAP